MTAHDADLIAKVAEALHADACPIDPDDGEACGCGGYEREAEIVLDALDLPGLIHRAEKAEGLVARMDAEVDEQISARVDAEADRDEAQMERADALVEVERLRAKVAVVYRVWNGTQNVNWLRLQIRDRWPELGRVLDALRTALSEPDTSGRQR